MWYKAHILPGNHTSQVSILKLGVTIGMFVKRQAKWDEIIA